MGLGAAIVCVTKTTFLLIRRKGLVRGLRAVLTIAYVVNHKPDRHFVFAHVRLATA